MQDSKAPGAITTGVRPGVDASTCRRCGAQRIDQQIGLEQTPEEYVQKLVSVFGEVRRVLAPHGTVWLNLGDSYNSNPAGKNPGGFQGEQMLKDEEYDEAQVRHVAGTRAPGTGKSKITSLAPKNLMGMPWRVALALQGDGWILRSDIIWAKPNPLPESITDRPTKSHEYIFMLAKSQRYFFDQEAVREPAEWNRWGDQTNTKYEGSQSSAGWIKPKTKEELNRKRSSYPSANTGGNSLDGHVPKSDAGLTVNPAGRNIRSVWQIATQSYADAHFAVFPEEIPKRAILAGCPEEVCRECGKPRERIVESTKSFESGSGRSGRMPTGKQDLQQAETNSTPDIRLGPVISTETLGWSDCGHDSYRRGVVLDIFGGSGTTAFVARKLARHSVLIELNESYCKLIAERLKQLSLFS